MLCANQQQIRESCRSWDEPPVLVDWLPWNHTFGGNHNVGLAIYNGGTLYIDEGKPTPAHRGDAAQPARDLAHGLLQRARRASRRSLSATGGRHAAARQVLPPRERCSSSPARRCRSPSGTTSTARRAGTGERIRCSPGLGMTETAPFFDLGQSRTAVRPYRPCPRPAWSQARPERRQDRGSRYGPERHAGLLARSRSRPREAFDDEGFYKSATRSSPSTRRPRRRLRVRRPHRRGLQAVHRHLRQRGPAARARHRRRRPLRAGRGGGRHQPRRDRRC